MTIILSNLSRFTKVFTGRFLVKFAVKCILKIPPHLAYVATLPCETLMSAKQAINDKLQGSVAAYLRCGGIFNMHLTANLTRNLPVKTFVNRLRFDRIMVMSLWPRFLAHPVYFWNKIYGNNFCQTALGNCYGLKLPNCCLQFKNNFIMLFVINFGILSFPVKSWRWRAWPMNAS